MRGAHGSITDNGNGVAALDYTTDLVGIGDAYTAMNERRAIKALLRIGV